ncbi:CHASE2 domain-containing protein [Alcaligenaceae bacterium]|nr:CHASE2 domain-containing protein [Alcaligenaceae bacterium]
MPRADASFWGSLERRIRVEWLLVSIAMLLFTMAISYFSDNIGLTRLNHAFYDRTLATATRPVNTNDIVIVTIDDGSIGEIGYWPWRRTIHAELLGRLQEAKVVGMDLVFSEVNPAYPQDDRILAEAIRKHGRVVLPLVLEPDQQTALAPLPVLAQAARRLGYINIFPDEDGVIRSITLQQEQAQGPRIEHFVMAMLQTTLQGVPSPHMASPGTAARLIPYAGAPGHFTMYPYAQVLNGQIPSSTFKDKYVLVGSWGSGLGDTFPTPVSNHGEIMAGVEIMANGLQSALHNHWISTPPRWHLAWYAALPVLLTCLGLRRRSPRQSFLLALAVLGLIFVSSWLLMRYASVWVPVSASLIGVALTYPVWSWRSQEAALQHIDHELTALNQEASMPINTLSPGSSPRYDSSLSARVIQLHNAIGQLRTAQQQREETLQFLSHDMRAPQNSILALTQLQQQPGSQLPEPELLRRVDLYAQKTLGLVDGFVQLARAEAAEIRWECMDLVELIALSCDDFWAQARQKNITIVFKEHPEMADINGNPTLLRRACCNLIDNAIKYSPVDTEVTCRILRDGADWLVSIRDQGRGISPRQQKTLFTRFMRASENAPDNPTGVGLGLAFTKAVVTRHEGSIQVVSAEGSGTEFILRFPAITYAS